jgi:uncharacterized protein (DUF362 family)/Pyruvate/2-oxoacid:ferredoxin oxidoreductase delta subunit
MSDVSLVRCMGYEREATMIAVRRAVDIVGGMNTFVKSGDRVLIKPNLLKAKSPESAVTTHPEVVRAVIRLVRECGGRPMVGDSPGMGDLKKVAEKAGILEVLIEEGAELTELIDVVQVKNTGRFQRFEVSRLAYEADVIINLPKLKTHGMTTLTGAVKNLFGCIPGKRKVQWHFNTGVNHGLFMRMLVELYALLDPQLTIMDAVIGMEGNGPGSGDPRWIGAILASRDGVALDIVAGKMVGVPPEKLPIIKAAAAAGIGATELDRIRILGEALELVAVSQYRLPPPTHLEWQIPEWARGYLKNAFTAKPLINHAQCIQCGICQGHCPQKAIQSAGKHLQIRYRECIRCFCCQEFCPRGAITVGRGWMLALLPRQKENRERRRKTDKKN